MTATEISVVQKPESPAEDVAATTVWSIDGTPAHDVLVREL
jgi:hypothetical protein